MRVFDINSISPRDYVFVEVAMSRAKTDRSESRRREPCFHVRVWPTSSSSRNTRETSALVYAMDQELHPRNLSTGQAEIVMSALLTLAGLAGLLLGSLQTPSLADAARKAKSIAARRSLRRHLRLMTCPRRRLADHRRRVLKLNANARAEIAKIAGRPGHAARASVRRGSRDAGSLADSGNVVTQRGVDHR